MPSQWSPGTQYNYDDVVVYEGFEYKIIQPHRSQGDWAPDIVPALWGRVGPSHGGGGGHGGHGHHHGGEYQQEQQQQQQQYSYGSGNMSNPSPATPSVEPTHEEKKTNWYDLDDHRKKQLEIGGGLAAGAALLAGGYAAWDHHSKSEEEKKAAAWGVSNWLQDAKNRTETFKREGPKGPYVWVLAQGTNIPEGAIEGGRENDGGDILYIARAFHEGGIHLGKAGRHLGKGAVIGYDNKEIEVDTYECLIGDPRMVKWVQVSSSDFQPNRTVEGGREADGTVLNIAQGFYKGNTHPGKYSSHLKGACFAYGGKEKIVEQFQILVLA